MSQCCFSFQMPRAIGRLYKRIIIITIKNRSYRNNKKKGGGG